MSANPPVRFYRAQIISITIPCFFPEWKSYHITHSKTKSPLKNVSKSKCSYCKIYYSLHIIQIVSTFDDIHQNFLAARSEK